MSAPDPATLPRVDIAAIVRRVTRTARYVGCTCPDPLDVRWHPDRIPVVVHAPACPRYVRRNPS